MANILIHSTNHIGSFAFADLPAASSVAAGTTARVTDIGAASMWMTDSTRWHPKNGLASLMHTAIPMILPSSGSIGDDGALSLTTSLLSTYPSCYMYFPEDAIAEGVAAGLYYVVMSAANAGTIYNNTYTSGKPTIPGSPTAFDTTGPGAYTQSTSEITLITQTLPGNSLGIDGELSIWYSWLNGANTANNKIARIRLGGTAVHGVTLNNANQDSNSAFFLRNMGSASVQSTNNGVSGSARSFQEYTSGAYGQFTIDTASDVSVTLTAQIAADANFFIYSSARMEIRA